MLNIIVAPKSYEPNAEKITKHIVKYLKSEKQEYAVYFSQDLEDVGNNVKELSALGETDYIIVGDDAIINIFLNAVRDISKIKLGIVPIGKHDDFASYIGISKNPLQAVKDILKFNVSSVDLMLVNEMKVLNSIEIGAGVEIFEGLQKYKIQNVIAEKMAEINYGNKFKGIELELNSKNSRTKKENIFELIVANGGRSKGKFISPLSNVKDGLFNVLYTIVGDENKKYIKKQNEGEHIYDVETKQTWVNNLKITNKEKEIKALVDGNFVKFESLDIVLIEEGLKIYKA